MKHWILAGNSPKEYAIGRDDVAIYEGKKTAYLKFTADKEPSGFGTLMQSFKADLYREKRLCFAASVKSENVSEWAGLWMRVDGKSKEETLEFDNMQGRAIKGTTEWQTCKVVLNVPKEADSVHFGILLSGKGQVWIAGAQVEEASPDEPTTDGKINLPDKPGNLDFSED